MSEQRPVFRIVKNGYDRFMVDDAIEKYASQVDALQQKVEVYQRQLAETVKQLDELKKKTAAAEQEEQAKRRANENIARVSIREANEIISTANKNADEIIRDSLSTAKTVLTDLTTLYSQAEKMKSQMNDELDALQKKLDAFELPKMPDISWLEETEKKLH